MLWARSPPLGRSALADSGVAAQRLIRPEEPAPMPPGKKEVERRIGRKDGFSYRLPLGKQLDLLD